MFPHSIKQLITIGIVGMATTVSSVLAEDQPAEPKANWSANIAVVNQYVFRGLTQTNGKPAFQGGIDYTHPSGWYAGTWFSTISWYTDQNAGTVSTPAALSSPGTAGAPYSPNKSNTTNLEWDIYGGYKHSLTEDWLLDVGLIQYAYPGTYENTGAYRKPNTTEVYGAINYKWITAKYSHGISHYTFGANESQGSHYIDLSATLPIADTGFSLLAHAGRQIYPDTPNTGYWGTSGGNNSYYSYNDYKLGLTKEILGVTIGAAWTYAVTKATAPDNQTTAYQNAYGKNIGGKRFVISISKSF